MTISGTPPKSSGLEPIEFVPADNAQQYIRNIADILSEIDGGPLFLVHDGKTGTSHNFIVVAVNYFNLNGSLKKTRLFMLIEACVISGNVFRIWYASDEVNIYQKVTECFSLSQVMLALEQQIQEGKDITIRYKIK